VKKVLFATDYLEFSANTLTYATSLACNSGATLLVTHVSELEQCPVGELFDEDPQPSESEIAKLRAIAPHAPRIPCEHRLLHGNPARESLLKIADRMIQEPK